MAVAADNTLRLFFLNVGQADTTVVVTPGGRVIVVDAARPHKLLPFFTNLNLTKSDPVDMLVLTHPHADHYGGASAVLNKHTIANVTLCPFWTSDGMGSPGYKQFVANLHRLSTHVSFLSGYNRIFPDAPVLPGVPFEDQVCIELLGPSNGLVRQLQEQKIFATNHLSIMTRISWKNRSFVIAADAQMENWSVFDAERMIESGCDVMRAAHHGSGNGTQWERVNRIRPSVLIVSSDTSGRHSLPDLTATAVFAKYAQDRKALVALTGDTGTVKVAVASSGAMTIARFQETRFQQINFANEVPLTRMNNPTNWKDVLLSKAMALR